jgi:phosphoribosyl 1,2-cyclic phosphodiesterase
MRVTLWGVRGSVPVPGPAVVGYGGNTSCVQVSSDEGTELILDAGTGIRELGAAIAGRCRRVHILLTHLHLDHIQGLMFFAPFFDRDVEVVIWGPPTVGRPLRERLGRYISSPLSPLELRELPANVTYKVVPPSPWAIDTVTVKASLVAHRGPTLGYRLAQNGVSVCYLPDHEPGLGVPLSSCEPGWISGHGLARHSSLLIYDCQYADSEYPAHRGWGHSSVSDALAFARRAEARHVLLFHHDPAHDDAQLDDIGQAAAARWQQLGGEAPLELAREGRALELA